MGSHLELVEISEMASGDGATAAAGGGGGDRWSSPLSSRHHSISSGREKIDKGVYAMFILFGLGSWITLNGLFAELPLFYKELPE
jgi:hypothetical protein